MMQNKEKICVDKEYRIKLSPEMAEILELEIGDEVDVELEYDHFIISKRGEICILCGSKREVEYFGGKLHFCKRCLSDMCCGLIEQRHKEYLEEMRNKKTSAI